MQQKLQNLAASNNKHFWCHYHFFGSGIQKQLSWVSGSMSVMDGCCLRARLESTSKVVHSRAWQVSAASHRSGPTFSLSVGLFVRPHDMTAGFRLSECSKRDRSCNTFYELASEVIRHHATSVTQVDSIYWELYRGVNTRRWDHPGKACRLTTTAPNKNHVWSRL